jgi:chemotaxis protein methyltransferase CheR
VINITLKEFRLLSEYIEAQYGIHLRDEKQSLLAGRLQNVLVQLGFDSFTQYYDYLITDKSGDAGIVLVDKISTNHTYFMRETKHFYYFRDKVLPILKNTVIDKDLRIWCAASSTGEEAYTLAMLVDEFLGKDKMWWDAKILATDISTSVLDTAKKGIYSNEQLSPLPSGWKSQYLNKYDNENSTFTDKIKNEVIFRRFNLMENVFPFKKKFHVIFCRNVMIYFDNKTKELLINKLYDMLNYGGYLFIGHSESINRETSRFKYICPAVYRKE